MRWWHQQFWVSHSGQWSYWDCARHIVVLLCCEIEFVMTRREKQIQGEYSSVSSEWRWWDLIFILQGEIIHSRQWNTLYTHCIDNDIYWCWAMIRDILSCVESGDCKTVNVILITDRARCWEYRVMMGGMSQLIVELMIQQWCQDQTLTNFIADIDTFWTFL